MAISLRLTTSLFFTKKKKRKNYNYYYREEDKGKRIPELIIIGRPLTLSNKIAESKDDFQEAKALKTAPFFFFFRMFYSRYNEAISLYF